MTTAIEVVLWTFAGLMGLGAVVWVLILLVAIFLAVKE